MKMKGKELKRFIAKSLNEYHEFEGSYVIEKIEDIINHYKSVSHEAAQKVIEIEKAWGDWDFDYLVGTGIISQSDADFIQKVDNEEIADDYELNPGVYEALKNKKVSLNELRKISKMGSWLVPESIAKKDEKIIRESFWKDNKDSFVIGISAIGNGKDGNMYVYYDECDEEK